MLACGLHPAGTHSAHPGLSPPARRDHPGRFTCRSQQLLRLFSFSLLCMPPCPPPVPSMHGWVGWLCCFRLPPSPRACMPSCSCSQILPPPGMIHRGQAAPLTEVVSSHPSFQGRTFFSRRGGSYDDYVKMKVLRNSNKRLQWDREFVFLM